MRMDTAEEPSSTPSFSSPGNDTEAAPVEEHLQVVPNDAILSTGDYGEEQEEELQSVERDVESPNKTLREDNEDPTASSSSSSSSSVLVKSPDPQLVSQQITQDIVSAFALR